MNTTENKALRAASLIPGYHQELESLAYIRPVDTGAGGAFAVCDQHGVQLAVYKDAQVAEFAARQHGLEPLKMH